MHTFIRTATILTLAALLPVIGGCSGSDSVAPTLPAGTADTAPPAVPTNLAATFTGSAVKLNWDANTVDADLLGYRVYLLAYGATLALVEEPLTATWWVSPSSGTVECTYAVTAVDVHGNESAWQTVAYAGPAAPAQRDALR